MRKGLTGAQGVKTIICLLLAVVPSANNAYAQNGVPPSPPTGLIATVASCGEVDLSWTAATDNSGTGLKSYTVLRNGGPNTTIGAMSTTFSDANWTKSSSTYTYQITVTDNAGNTSIPSNAVTVTTPACPVTAGEQVVD